MPSYAAVFAEPNATVKSLPRRGSQDPCQGTARCWSLAGYSEALSFEVRPFGIRVALVEPAAHRTHIQLAHPHSPLSCYGDDRARVEAIIQAQVDHGDDPDNVVRAILAGALGGRATRLRYRVGSTARLVSLARRFLSDEGLARIVRREFRLSS